MLRCKVLDLNSAVVEKLYPGLQNSIVKNAAEVFDMKSFGER